MFKDVSNSQQLRLYTFTNVYISSIQKGIQTAHVVSDMYTKYSNESGYFNAWASDHKTIIVLNGGNQEMLSNTFMQMKAFGFRYNYPFVSFHEDEQSLNGALTAIGIVLPEEIYDLKKSYINEDGTFQTEQMKIVTQLQIDHPFLTTLFNASLAI